MLGGVRSYLWTKEVQRTLDNQMIWRRKKSRYKKSYFFPKNWRKIPSRNAQAGGTGLPARESPDLAKRAIPGIIVPPNQTQLERVDI